MNPGREELHRAAWFTPHAALRTDAYVLLGALLTRAPCEAMIDMVRNLGWEDDLPLALQRALTRLRTAAETCPLDSIAGEYHRIFVGLGCGELVPYGSWYREKMIQSAPLARIRAALRQLGIVRRPESPESEDHAGALCEVMALLSLPANAVPDEEQAAFFFAHIDSWMEDFFADLHTIRHAAFYPALGGFGLCFLEAERDYLGAVSARCIVAPKPLPAEQEAEKAGKDGRTG